VVQHRLPLFFRSDLYSEYKISKLLTSASPEVPIARKSKKCTIETSVIYQDLEAIEENQSQWSAENKMKKQSSPLNLPEISGSGLSRSGSSVEFEAPRSPGVVLSKSDAELDVKSSSNRLERRVKWHRSLSVEPGSLPTYASTLKSKSNSTSELNGKPGPLLGTKSGMNALWKFLKGKVGEKNLLFWLDAERIKYYTDDTDRQRFVEQQLYARDRNRLCVHHVGY
jgi:hypothetical protein